MEMLAVWNSYKRFSKEHWNGILNASFKFGIIRTCIGGLYHFMALFIGSMFYITYGVLWIMIMCMWWIPKYFVLGIIAFVRLITGKPEFAKFLASPSPSMDGWQYEQYVAIKLKKRGYHNVQVTSGSGDYGVDIIANDLMGRKYCIQCKRYSSPVGVKAIQEVLAGKVYYKGDVAMVITNSTFTNAAVEMANQTGVVLHSHFV